MSLKINLIVFLFFLASCQPIEILTPTEIDNTRLESISINAKDLSINIKYKPIFSEENIEDQLKNPPIELLTNWLNENIIKFGSQNTFKINILDASIYKKEIQNVNAKKYEEKTIFKYEIYFLVEYELYDDSDILLANTTVESFRSTTSQKYISLNERDLIINDLLFKSLIDFTNETKSMINLYMSQYLL